MKEIAFLSGFISGLLTLGINLPASCEVISDGTTNTTVNRNGNNFNILNGIPKGNNLFHSFKEFSIPTGGSATFQNSSTIVNIINRVTGGNVSNIDGLIKANGSANVFLINPAGIVFGENARLDIGGSFLGTTAESILFEDVFEFSAVNAQSESLLTVSVPIGLQMGQQSGAIQVNGNGHQLTGGLFTPANRTNTQSTLQVNSGNAIALVGRNLAFNGAVLTAENGRIEIGSVELGTVGINSQNFQLNYDNVEKFGDIQLVQQSLLDASGLTSRGIQLQGQNISLKDGSATLIQTTGSQTPSGIKVSASGSLELSGNVRTAPDMGIVTGVISTRFMTETLGSGKGADIDVSAGNLRLNDGGIFMARTYSALSGGNINVNVAGDIQANRTAPLNPNLPSAVATTNFSSGELGDINIIASNIALIDGGAINATNFGQGDGGNVDVNVSGTIEVRGLDLRILAPSSMGSTAFREGNSGYLNINTSKLIVGDGGGVSTSVLNSGDGGKITINASEFIEVRGSSPDGQISSGISTSVSILPEVFRQSAGLPDIPSGDAGSLTINTPKLQVDTLGTVSVDNQGLGNGGSLTINTNSLQLTNKGKLIATTASGEGGNINLNLQSDLILRNNSLINTEALGTGNGGNIIINSPIIAGFENSDIIANAVQGNGGNINIATQGIFGLEFREQLTSESDITASSQFGVNGTVEINNLSIDPSSGLVELTTGLADSSQQIATGCSSNTNSSFVATGRGGIPQNPNESVDMNSTWSDIRDLSAFPKQNSNTSNSVENALLSNQQRIVEATGFILNAKGEIELVASGTTPFTTTQIYNCRASLSNNTNY